MLVEKIYWDFALTNHKFRGKGKYIVRSRLFHILFLSKKKMFCSLYTGHLLCRLTFYTSWLILAFTAQPPSIISWQDHFLVVFLRICYEVGHIFTNIAFWASLLCLNLRLSSTPEVIIRHDHFLLNFIIYHISVLFLCTLNILLDLGFKTPYKFYHIKPSQH